MNTTYDIVIIGAGPAGLAAGRRLMSSSSTPNVLLVDKIEPWNHPIACAEGVYLAQFNKIIEPKLSWIRFIIDKAIYYSPNNTTLHYTDKNKGYILDRATMQRDLANECISRGIDCRFGSRVVSVGTWQENGHRKIGFADGSSVTAQIVIDCSGPLSAFGAGEKIHCKAKDLEVAYLAHLHCPSAETQAVHIHAGRLIAPGAYAWAFPRSATSINVGVIVGTPFKATSNIRRLLDSFIATHYPDCSVEQRFAGAIPCAYGNPPLAIAGLIKAGDAASMVNPITRAGISEAMLGGTLAASCALDMLGATSTKKISTACKKYEKAWHETNGKRHQKLAKVKHALAKIPDSDYDTAARTLDSIPRDQLTMSRIFAASMSRFPRLVWALRHLM